MPTLSEANLYFETHLSKTVWEAADESTRTALLTTAAAEINSLPLKTTIDPGRKNKAIFEQALFRLVVSDKRESLRAQGVKSISIHGGASETYASPMFGISLAPRAKLFLMGQFQLGAIV